MAEGWICPRCGRALAPWMSECPCYMTKVEITSNFQLTLTGSEMEVIPPGGSKTGETELRGVDWTKWTCGDC